MPKTLKLISWNVHFPSFAKDNTFVIEALEKLGRFDVICLQEFVEGADGRLMQWLADNHYETTYLPFATTGDFSQGLLTAIRKGLRAKVDPITLREDAPKRLRPFVNIRGLLTATIQLGSKQITINNTHLTYPRLHTRDMRSREFTELTEFLGTGSPEHPWLMCGDFNFFGKDSRKKYLTSHYQNFTGNRRFKTWRHNHRYTPVRANLDYFFWKGQDLQVKPSLAPFDTSDHRPLIAEVTL